MDDEQKQVLDQSEWAAFFLSAAAYLCDIGLLDGNAHGGANPTTGDNQADQAAPKSLGQLSPYRIRRRWKDLGITDAARAEIVAEIALRMDPQDSPKRDERDEGRC